MKKKQRKSVGGGVMHRKKTAPETPLKIGRGKIEVEKKETGGNRMVAPHGSGAMKAVHAGIERKG
jgi:hypothetical protein